MSYYKRIWYLVDRVSAVYEKVKLYIAIARHTISQDYIIKIILRDLTARP